MKKYNVQSGVVALITSIVVGLLLVAITTGAVGIMAAELRNSTDFDQSVRAYYAAESGVEDAINYIRNNVGNITPNTTCTTFHGNNNLSGDGVVSYTCQLISVEQQSLTGRLRAEESNQVSLVGIGADGVSLEWNLSSPPSTDPQPHTGNGSTWCSQTGTICGGGGTPIPPNFPASKDWQNQFPAVIEFTFISYPSSGTFTSSQVNLQTLVLKPSPGALYNRVFTLDEFSLDDNPIEVGCDPTQAYNCKATVILHPGLNYEVRMQARYSGTHYNLTATLGGSIADSVALVDVTGKAGDVLRRVLVQIPLTPQPVNGFALLADDQICKVLEVSKITGFADVEDPTVNCP